MNTPSEAFEPARPKQAAAAMTGSRRARANMPVAPADALAPLAVDAVFADDNASIVAQRGSRRDLNVMAGTPDSAMHKVDVPHVATSVDIVSDAQATRLLRSLGHQIDALREQQEQIRRMIEQVEMFATQQ
jgi:hypothetical protein